MATTTATTANAWLPEDFGGMLDLVVQAKSVAARASTVFGTTKNTVNFPTWVADPAVAFYNELDTIAETDGDTDEVAVPVYKTAGLVLVGNETADDTTPAIADQIAHALANQIAKAVDAAFFANTTSKAFDGLLAKASTAVDTGASLTNLDSFIAGRYTAETNGAHLTHWLMDPSTAQTLSLLKRQSGSNESLLEFVEDGMRIAGLPVITSTDVDSATFAFGIDSTQQRYVLRKGTVVERFPSVTNDGTYVRAITRVGWNTLNPAGIVRLYDVA